jgi:hypothetical protein
MPDNGQATTPPTHAPVAACPRTRLGAMLPIYHVRKAREFRRSFLLATTVFKNKSLILDSEGPGDQCGARH